VVEMFNTTSCIEDCNAVSRQGGDTAGTEVVVFASLEKSENIRIFLSWRSAKIRTVLHYMSTPSLNYKPLLALLGLFFVGIVTAYFFEWHYRKLVTHSFQMLYGDNIKFIYKDIHLFPDEIFLIAFGLFTSIAFLLLKYSARQFRTKRICFMIFTFFATTILAIALESKRLIFECANCEEELGQLTFRKPSYNLYFIVSLSASLIYLATVYLLEHRRISRTNKSMS
jgi:hypothetical protein